MILFFNQHDFPFIRRYVDLPITIKLQYFDRKSALPHHLIFLRNTHPTKHFPALHTLLKLRGYTYYIFGIVRKKKDSHLSNR